MDGTGTAQFTNQETSAMLRLPRKECQFQVSVSIQNQFTYIDLLSTSEIHDMYLTLVTFLFSYAYELRSTKYDFNPESAWTICTLTPAISALDPPPYGMPTEIAATTSPASQFFSRGELLATLIPCYRRSLAFPLYRSFALADACRKDVAGFLLMGQRTVIRCLLDLKHILDHHEVYYVYSKIWVDDICTWLQTCARFAALCPP
jgi:protein SHQ1